MPRPASEGAAAAVRKRWNPGSRPGPEAVVDTGASSAAPPAAARRMSSRGQVNSFIVASFRLARHPGKDRARRGYDALRIPCKTAKLSARANKPDGYLLGSYRIATAPE